MKPTLLIIGFFVALSAAAMAVIGWTVGRPSSQLPVEIMNWPRTGLTDEAMRAMLESAALRTARGPQVLVLGASGAQEAYRPGKIKKVGDFKVNNFAVSAANITEMKQTLHHCLKSLRTGIAKQSVIVLGLNYPLFVADEVRWRHPDFVSPAIVSTGLLISDIERSAMRNPVVCDSERWPFKILPSPVLTAAKTRCSYWYQLSPKVPDHLGDRLLDWQGWRWTLPSSLGGDRTLFPKPAPPAGRQYTPHEQMDWLTAYMGNDKGLIPAQQFDHLQELIRDARAAGLRVVVVDMPLPSWHRAESPFVAPYRAALQAALVPFASDKGTHYIDLSQAIPDDEFRDSIHPTYKNKDRWIQSLAVPLGAYLAQ